MSNSDRFSSITEIVSSNRTNLLNPQVMRQLVSFCRIKQPTFVINKKITEFSFTKPNKTARFKGDRQISYAKSN